MSATQENIVNEILKLESEITRKVVAGEDIKELAEKRKQLQEQLQEIVKKQDDKSSLLKG